jgi:site-specific DNA-methyltransferase (adenine-specific)
MTSAAAAVDPRRDLYFGDNLRILRKFIAPDSVDLIYLDPPFNNQATYNHIFRAISRREGVTAQGHAFVDTWTWGKEAESTLQYLTTTAEHGGSVPEKLSSLVDAVVRWLGRSDMSAYLVMMAPRLVEMHRVLRPTGTLYLHCDPTASHYLRLLLDAVFSPERFLNEITWKRTFSHGNVARNFGAISDRLLVYTKGPSYEWNQVFTPFPSGYIERAFRYEDANGRRWQSVTLRNPAPRPNLRYTFTASNGVAYKPHPNGWGVDVERMRKYDREGRLHFPAKATGALRLKMFLDESPGIRLQNIWDDIPPIGALAAERQGYPTQKPLALLERIIATSSNEGDVVLDPFCGCGTAVVAAEKLKRSWVGIDITPLAIRVVKTRLRDAFGMTEVRELGVPADIDGARELAEQSVDGRYEFQWWALTLVDAHPPARKKKGADQGIDGVATFADSDGMKRIVVSVKSGNVGPDAVRSLHGTVEREHAAMGILITLEGASPAMRREATAFGFYESPMWGRKFPRLQIFEVTDHFDGKRPTLPPSTGLDIDHAPRVVATPAQESLPLGPIALARPPAKSARVRRPKAGGDQQELHLLSRRDTTTQTSG